jgi:carboxyl-terminal processing protease
MKAKEKITLGLIRISSVQDLDKLKPITRVSLKAAPVVIDEERLSYTSEPYGDSIIGKLTLNFFYENANGITAEKDILAAIEKLQKKGNLKGLILDLRENAGGFLNQAVKVSGVFVSNGVIVVSKYSGGAIRYLRTMGSKKAFSGPLIVLTSKLSASASEIVAQSLQDYGVALIVGDRRTFGKGSIQFQTVTSENADLFFKVTVGKYYTVSGKSTQIKGVLADIVVPSFFSPYPYGEKYLDNPLSNDSIHPSFWDSLEDIGGREREWMLANYIPNLQKEISVWKKMLPILKKNSNYRLKNDPNFKLFLKKMESIRLSLEDKKIMKDKNKDNYGVEDLQMQEAVNIIKDMIFLKDFSNKQ